MRACFLLEQPAPFSRREIEISTCPVHLFPHFAIIHTWSIVVSGLPGYRLPTWPSAPIPMSMRSKAGVAPPGPDSGNEPTMGIRSRAAI